MSGTLTPSPSSWLFLILTTLTYRYSCTAVGNPDVDVDFVVDSEPVEPLLDAQIIPRSLFPDERADLRSMREALRAFAERSGKHGDDAWKMLRATNRAQVPVPRWKSFPCATSAENPARSPSPPKSVHRLRPGDVDVVAAMGDSLTAGSGVLATNPLQVYIEDRGVAFPAGGERSWRDALTVPNILKHFNPELRGFSDGSAFSYEPASRLNVAEPAARSTDMLHQAKLLVRRIRADESIRIEEHWKLVTLMVGANDACHVCYEDAAALPSRHAAALVEALDYLRDNLPRTLVSVVVVPDVVSALLMQGRSAICGLLTLVECPCLSGRRFEDQRDQFHQVLQRLQAVQLQLGSLPRYSEKEDFAVEVQPWTTQLQLPRTAGPDSLHDMSIFSADCFHFSQRGNALAANALWNNMMEPSSHKSHGLPESLFSTFQCPTLERPYLATYGNTNSTFTVPTASAAQTAVRQNKTSKDKYRRDRTQQERSTHKRNVANNLPAHVPPLRFIINLLS